MQTILIANFVNLPASSYHGYYFPVWAQVIGWMTAIGPLILVPIAAVYTYRQDVSNNAYSAETFLQVSFTYLCTQGSLEVQ